MYSVILAAMLAGAGQQTQGWHRTASCYGCTGGACVGSYACTGCYGCTGYYGCSGGHGHGRLFGGHGHCHGCIGSANYGCNGFTGYTVGYAYWASGCYGSSCFGGCYGTGGIGCYGWTGGYASVPAYSGLAAFAEAEHFPGVTYSPMVPAGSVGTVVPATSSPPAPAPVAPPMPGRDAPPAIQPVAPPAAPKGGIPDAPKGLELPKAPEGLKPINHENTLIPAATPTTARMIVHLPADAKLWVDMVPCPLAGETRAFNTPALIEGAQYAYTITIETPDGARSNRRVTMTAGRTVEVDFRGVETVQK